MPPRRAGPTGAGDPGRSRDRRAGRRGQAQAAALTSPGFPSAEAMPPAQRRISSQSRRSANSEGVFLTIARSTKFLGLEGTRPPNTTCSRAPSDSTLAITLGGEDHSAARGSSVGFPTGPELNAHHGRPGSAARCRRRKRRAEGRQRFMYTALPSTTAPYGSRSRTSPASRKSVSRPWRRSSSAIACAISAVDPFLLAYATRTLICFLLSLLVNELSSPQLPNHRDCPAGRLRKSAGSSRE